MALAGAFKKVDNLRKVMQGVEALTETTVMVGVPQDKGGRREGQIGNADLAYIHDKGSVAAGIPARPFMEPGIKAVQDQIEQEMLNAGKAVFKGGAKSVEGYLNRVGLIASRSIKMMITEGIAPPLAPSTIKGRIYRLKNKKRRASLKADLAAGVAGSRIAGAEGLFTPLVVTGQLRNAITYVLRKLRKNGK
jgi:hypothetical protein